MPALQCGNLKYPKNERLTSHPADPKHTHFCMKAQNEAVDEKKNHLGTLGNLS